jgi:hypothetical protein
MSVSGKPHRYPGATEQPAMSLIGTFETYRNVCDLVAIG